MLVTLDNIEDSILPLVSKPNRYIGNFEGAYRKDHRSVTTTVALAFPDCFDLGMSHLGIKILYRLVNERDDALAELVFAPWPDMEERMREHGLPLFSLETRKPVGQFDVLGFSLQYELHYTTVLNMLDLAGIPVRSKDRDGGYPLVIGGGPCSFSPEPVAPFFDAFLVGDGEEGLGPVLDALALGKRQGGSRAELLERISRIEGAYVPSMYRVRPNSLGHVVPEPRDGAPERVKAARIEKLGGARTRPAHLVPLTDITHSRLSVEVMRGCPRRCRFCMPGAIYRPVRRKSEEDVLVELRDGMASGGWDEVSLLSLSTSDYKGISELVGDVSKLFLGRGVNVSLPSIRPGTLPPQLARSLTYVRKSGLTFAPEAGTERLRRVIDKGITEEEMVESVKVAAGAGWNAVKLYFMIGLPTETEQDVLSIAELAGTLKRAARSAGKRIDLKVNVAGFVPKAHTPFQWEAQTDMREMASRMSALNRAMKAKGLRMRWRDVEVTFVEGLLSRGDRRLSEVVEAAWRGGSRFDGWTDLFDFGVWRSALDGTGIDAGSYLGPRSADEPQPWSHIGAAYSKDTLLRERERAYSYAPGAKAHARGGERPALGGDEGRPSENGPPAAEGGRGGAGAAGGRGGPLGVYGRTPKKGRKSRTRTGSCFRLMYSKGEPVRFISHLDVVRVFDRALRRANLPIAFSEGFNKHPKLAFGPPLAVGMTSAAEYLDLEFAVAQSASFCEKLGEALPDGLSALRAEPHGSSRPASLMSSITVADYRIGLPECLVEELEERGGRGSVENAFRSAESRLAGRGDSDRREARDGPWSAAVLKGSVSRDAAGPELLLTVRLNVKKGPKVVEIARELLSPLEFDPRLLRIERTALWIERGAVPASPFDVLADSFWGAPA